jgi:hypothetical protein
MHQMNFKNNSYLPIVVSSWIPKMVGLSEYVDVTIPPYTEQIVTYSVGQWALGSLFENSEYIEQWENAKLLFTSKLAVFIDKPGFHNTRTWNFMENRFHLTYENNVIVWSDK